MLVLSRFPGQSVVIGDGPGKIVVTVARVRGDKVVLGFDAKPDIPIHRLEIWEDVQREKRALERAERDDDDLP